MRREEPYDDLTDWSAHPNHQAQDPQDDQDYLEAFFACDVPWEVIFDQKIKEMNQKHFVVPINGRSVIAAVIHDEALDRDRLVYSEAKDLKLQYDNQLIKVGVKENGKDIHKGLGTAWIEHPKRRTYQKMALLPKGNCPPDVFNLWRGFGIEPADGDWPMIREHLRTVICSGNEIHFAWLLGWLAYCVQHPDKPAEVAVVLRGKKGTGKGMLGQVLMRIFRHHALHIADVRHLVGNFNGHLADVLFLFVDEAIWAGDKVGENKLKALITEKAVMIEPKGINGFPMPNRLKILMASNNEWVVPASSDERRFFMLDVSDCKKGDAAYFERLAAAIEGDELQAFLAFLQDHDLTAWPHRAPPHTDALNEQKLISADSVQRYWLECLNEGEIIGTDLGGEWPVDVPVQVLHAAYVEHAEKHGDRRPVTIEQFAKRLAPLMPEGKLGRVRPRKPYHDDQRPWRYELKSLAAHRQAFLAALNIDSTSHAWATDE